jgi:uncharacterized coiled-coil protein SlyX
MTKELESLGLTATPKEIKIRKLEKKLAFYQIYTKKLQEKLQKCEDKFKATQRNESGHSK